MTYVHFVKLPPKIFKPIENGADTITLYDPEGDISEGDTLFLYLFNTETELTVKRIKRRVLDIKRRSTGIYSEAKIGVIE